MSYAAHLTVPDGAVGDFGVDVAQFAAEELGRPLDLAQREAVAAMTAYDRAGQWVALESAVIMARQNGKTAGTVTPIALWDLFTGEPDRIVWTAHLFPTAVEAFRDHHAMIDANDRLARRVRKVMTANGKESIELTNRARLDYLARSESGGRGLGGKRVVIDEALVWTGSQAGALLPVLAARPDPQIMYASSAAKGNEGSDYLRALAKRGRAGDPSLVWVEHCAAGGWGDPGCRMGADCPHTYGIAACSLDDESLWVGANPALDVRVGREFLRQMRRTLPALEFGREFLGWHEQAAGEDRPPVTAEAWGELADPGSRTEDRRIVFAVQLAGNGKAATVAACGRRNDGRWHVEIIQDRPGVEWVLDYVVGPRGTEGLLARHPESLLVLLNAGATAQLVPELVARSVPMGTPGKADGHRVELLTLGQHAAGCALLDTLVREGRLRHPASPDGGAWPQWAISLQGAAKRTSGDGWSWSIRDSVVDPLHLIAATNAVLGAARREGSSILDSIH